MWFCELNERRSRSERGPNPISFEALVDWGNLKRRTMQPYELELLLLLDRLWVNGPAEAEE